MKISDEIISIINEAKFVPSPVFESSNLYMDLGFDSLSFVQLLLRIEETFGITFALLEMGMCLQVKMLIALVEKKVKDAEDDKTLVNKPEELGENCCN